MYHLSCADGVFGTHSTGNCSTRTFSCCLAHGRIYSNHGAMTPGACGETADGMSLVKIGRIIDALRHERYRFPQPVKRVYIPKKSGAMRSLGLPAEAA